MSKVIRISDSIFQRLQALAEPLVDTPASVIERLLDHYQTAQREHASPPPPANESVSTFENDLSSRASRQRGTVVKLKGSVLQAESVSDLYEQVMRYLIKHGHMKQLEPLLPIATSKKRYLLAKHPKHPNGKDFIVPVEYQGFFMEAHKDYKNAVNHLRSRILDRLGLDLEYLA